MISKSQIQFVKSLQMKKFRELHQAFVVEGPKMVEELLGGKITVMKIFAGQDWKKAADTRQLENIEVITAGESDLARISSLKTPNQVLAVAKIESEKPLTAQHFSDLVLVLDGMNDPGNLGTILRVADWFGIKTVICSENTVDLYNPKTIQASMGSLFRVNVYYKNLVDLLREVAHDVEIFGTFLNGENIYTKPLPEKGIIIIGSESHGISAEVAKMVNRKLFIPSFSKGAESLNASIATAIVCSEFRRRKN